MSEKPFTKTLTLNDINNILTNKYDELKFISIIPTIDILRIQNGDSGYRNFGFEHAEIISFFVKCEKSKLNTLDLSISFCLETFSIRICTLLPYAHSIKTLIVNSNVFQSKHIDKFLNLLGNNHSLTRLVFTNNILKDRDFYVFRKWMMSTKTVVRVQVRNKDLNDRLAELYKKMSGFRYYKLLILLDRHFNADSFFSKDNLPLDLLKEIFSYI